MTDASLNHSGWLEIAIDIPPVTHEALSSFLFDLGCEGIILEEVSSGSILKSYIPFPKNSSKVRKRIERFLLDLKEIFKEAETYKLTLKRIDDQDWGMSWRKFFRPERITPNLIVTPAWEPISNPLNGHVIMIDPGLAFGTGKHPTTQMCLKAMERARFRSSWTMLDVGTGSGILAVYGVKLGADRVVAIDIDQQAIEWAKKTIGLNDVSQDILLSTLPLHEWKERFSLITANLVLNIITDVLHDLCRVLEPDGQLILSGILKEQVKDIKRLLSKYGLCEEYTLHHEGWACMVVSREDM